MPYPPQKVRPLPGIRKSRLVYDGKIRRQAAQGLHKQSRALRAGDAVLIPKRRAASRARGRKALDDRPPDAQGRGVPRDPQAGPAQDGGKIRPVCATDRNRHAVLAAQFQGGSRNPESGQHFGTGGMPAHSAQGRDPGAAPVPAVIAHGMAQKAGGDEKRQKRF
jgi:hypothetical protein